MQELEDAAFEPMLWVCTYCGSNSEYPRALCEPCLQAHKAKACEARAGSCHACNMIELEGELDE